MKIGGNCPSISNLIPADKQENGFSKKKKKDQSLILEFMDPVQNAVLLYVGA